MISRSSRHPAFLVFTVLAVLSGIWYLLGAPISLITQIAIYTLYGAGVCLLVSYTGLVPFGVLWLRQLCGGVRDAARRRQRNRRAGVLRAVLAAAGGGDRGDHPAPPRPVFFLADAGVFADRVRDILQMDRGDRCLAHCLPAPGRSMYSRW